MSEVWRQSPEHPTPQTRPTLSENLEAATLENFNFGTMKTGVHKSDPYRSFSFPGEIDFKDLNRTLEELTKIIFTNPLDLTNNESARTNVHVELNTHETQEKVMNPEGKQFKVTTFSKIETLGMLDDPEIYKKYVDEIENPDLNLVRFDVVNPDNPDQYFALTVSRTEPNYHRHPEIIIHQQGKSQTWNNELLRWALNKNYDPFSTNSSQT